MKCYKESANAAAAVIKFAPGTSEEKALKFMKELEQRGIIVQWTCHGYNDEMGDPVWYIP